MNYKIIDVEGIGEVYAGKLIAAGIKNTDELLAACKTSKGRADVAEKSGISKTFILKWANHADLYRVHGVGPQFAELLEASGVDTVKEFRHRVAANLCKKMNEVNEEKHLVRRVPSENELQKMIDEAKTLDPMMEY